MFYSKSNNLCSVQMARKGMVRRSEMTRADINTKVFDDRHPILKKGCHGNPRKSFWVKGHPFPLCARCAFLYPTIPFGVIGCILLNSLFDPSSLIMTGIVSLLISPMVIDGLTQYYCARSSNNILRAVTGALAGIGSGLALFFIISRSINLFQ